MVTRLKQVFLKRPLLAWGSLAILAYLGYYGGRWVSCAPLQLALTSLSGLIYAVCILTSPFFINLAGYLQNRHRNDRLLNAAAIPFLWMTKDVVLLSASHPLVESLYWYFNPMYIFYTCIVLVQIQLASALGRGLSKRRGAEIRVWSPKAVALIGAPLLIMAAIYSWGQGENLHALYLEGYRRIFLGE